MKVSKTAKVAAAAATVAIVASYVNAKKPPKPPPEPGLTLHYELKGAYRYPFPGEDNGSLAAWGSLLLPQNGKYICAGTHFGDDMTFVHATQWNGDGTVDTSFGTYEGSVLYDFGITVGEERHHNWARNAVIQHHDGMDKIVIVGSYDKWAAPYIARLLPDGSLDETFGIGGVVNNILVGTRAGFTLVTVLSDGSLLAAGVNGTTDPICPLLVKFTPEGDVDSTFGVEGYSAPNLGQNGFIRWGKGLVELPDGRIIAPGSSSDYETSAVFMFDGNGFLDTSFGNGGVAEINIQPNGTEFFNSLVVQPDGKIVAVGATSTGISGSIYGAADDPAERFSIARFNSDGTLDKRKFAKPRGGTQLDLAGGGVAEFTSLELLSDGRILAVGWGCPELDGPAEVYMARFATNGSLDTSFDDDGWVSLRFFSGDGACDVVVLGDHNYVLLAHGTDPIYGLTPYLADIWEE